MSVLAELAALVEQVAFPRGHQIFGEGEPGDCGYLICTGKVKVGRRSGRGQVGLFAILGPMDLLGELSAVDPGPRTSSAIALTPVRAACIDRETLRHWMNERPDLVWQMLHSLTYRLHLAEDNHASFTFNDVAGRLAQQLLLLGEKFGRQTPQGLWVAHDLTQCELAQLIGTTRETVNKTLVDFSDRGWIRLEPRSTIIIDPARLARRAP